MNFNQFAYKRRSSALSRSIWTSKASTDADAINGFEVGSTATDSNSYSKCINKPGTENSGKHTCIAINESCVPVSTASTSAAPDLSSSSKECIDVSSDSDLETEMNKPLSSVHLSDHSETNLRKDTSKERECEKKLVDTGINSSQELTDDNSSSCDEDEEICVESLNIESKINKLKEMFPKEKEERLRRLINRTNCLTSVVGMLSWLHKSDEGSLPDSPDVVSTSKTRKRPVVVSDDECAETSTPRKGVNIADESTQDGCHGSLMSTRKFYGNTSKPRKRPAIVSDDECEEIDTPNKRIKSSQESMQDSCQSSLISSRKFNSNSSVDKEEQKALKKLKEIFPSQAEKELLKLYHSAGSVKAVVSGLCGSPKKPSHKHHSDSEESDNEDDELAPDQKIQILSFLEDCSIPELVSIPGCSLKKAEKLAQLRPFGSWKNMVSKLDSTKGFNSQIVFDCLSLLEEREQVNELMARCERISNTTLKILSSRMDTSSVNAEKNVDDKAIGDNCNGDSDNNDDGGGGNDDEVVVLSPTKVKSTGGNVAIVSQPQLLNKSLQLKPYQMTGLNWLVLMHEQKMNGILADEMGLGKTVQTISFLAHLAEKGEKGPHVVVVPASTFDNWVREFQQWLPSLKCIQYYGSIEERAILRDQLIYGEVEFDVVITTYSMAISSSPDRMLFRKLNCHYAIFDEAHMLKNMQSQRYVHLMNFKTQRRLLLTGTPLQNNLLELMSLLSFVMPSLFGARFEGIKLLFSNKSNSGVDNTYEKERVAQAKRIMKPFVLRRLKKDVLKQLPEKHEHVIRCELSEKQRRMYDELFLDCSKEYRKGAGRKCENLLMELRKMANHPLLCRREYNDEKLWKMARLYCKDLRHRDSEPDLVHEDMTVMSDFELHRLCLEEEKLTAFALDKKLFPDCGKFNYLDNILPEMKRKGDRVLLFSQFTMVMDVVEEFLKMRGHRFLRLDGTTPVVTRQSLIDEFNSDPRIFVFLLSTKAGGLGINLTSANVVIINDIDYNPYNDKQAEDRCHRVGQTRDVHVYKVIGENTVEEAMLTCAERKLRLEQDIAGEDQNSEGNSKDVLMLLNEVFKGRN